MCGKHDTGSMCANLEQAHFAGVKGLQHEPTTRHELTTRLDTLLSKRQAAAMRGLPDAGDDVAATLRHVEWSAVEEGFRLLERDLGKLQVRSFRFTPWVTVRSSTRRCSNSSSSMLPDSARSSKNGTSAQSPRRRSYISPGRLMYSLSSIAS